MSIEVASRHFRKELPMSDPNMEREMMKIRLSLRSIAASLVARECREIGDSEGAAKYHEIAQELPEV